MAPERPGDERSPFSFDFDLDKQMRPESEGSRSRRRGREREIKETKPPSQWSEELFDGERDLALSAAKDTTQPKQAALPPASTPKAADSDELPAPPHQWSERAWSHAEQQPALPAAPLPTSTERSATDGLPEPAEPQPGSSWLHRIWAQLAKPRGKKAAEEAVIGEPAAGAASAPDKKIPPQPERASADAPPQPEPAAKKDGIWAQLTKPRGKKAAEEAVIGEPATVAAPAPDKKIPPQPEPAPADATPQPEPAAAKKDGIWAQLTKPRGKKAAEETAAGEPATVAAPAPDKKIPPQPEPAPADATPQPEPAAAKKEGIWAQLTKPRGKKAAAADAPGPQPAAEPAPAEAEEAVAAEPTAKKPGIWAQLTKPRGKKAAEVVEAEAHDTADAPAPVEPAAAKKPGIWAQLTKPRGKKPAGEAPAADAGTTGPDAFSAAQTASEADGEVEQRGGLRGRLADLRRRQEQAESTVPPPAPYAGLENDVSVPDIIESRSEAPTVAEEDLSPEQRLELESERAKREREREKRRLERAKKEEGQRDRRMKSADRKRRRAEAKERSRLEKETKREEKARRKADQMLGHLDDQEIEERHFDEMIPFVGPRLRAHRQRKFERAEAKEAEKKEAEKKPGAAQTLFAPYYRWRQDRARRLGRNIIGLHIGASALRAVHLREGKPAIIAERRIPEGIILDGLIEEPDELTAEIKALWRDSNLSSKKVNFSITNRLVALRTIQMPAHDEDDIEQALAMNAGQVIAPMDPKESIIDYAELSRSGPNVSLQVAAADEEMVKSYAKAIASAGLFAVSCEIGPLAAGRALVVPRTPDDAHVVLDIGAETTSFLTASGPDIFFLSVIEIGGNDFTRAIEAQLGVGWAEAEKLKLRSGLGTEPADPELDRDLFERSRAAMRPIADRLCQEVVQTRNFYTDSRGGRNLIGYSLLGGGARLSGLIEQIEMFTGLSNRVDLKPWPGLEKITDLGARSIAVGLARGHTMSLMPEIESRSFALAIPGTRRKSKISMDEADRTAKRLASRRKSSGTNPKMVGMLIAIAILGGSFYGSHWLAGKNEENAATVQTAKRAAAAAARRLPAPVYEGFSEANGATDLAASLTGHPDWRVMKKPLATMTDKAVIVDRIDVNGGEVKITGRLPDDISLAWLREQVAKSPGVLEATSEELQLVAGQQAFAIKFVVPMGAGDIDDGGE